MFKDEREKLQRKENAKDFPDYRKGEVADLCDLVDVCGGTVEEFRNAPQGRVSHGIINFHIKYTNGELDGRDFDISLTNLSKAQMLLITQTLANPIFKS